MFSVGFLCKMFEKANFIAERKRITDDAE